MVIKVLTDSTSNINEAVRDSLDISLVPLSVDFGDIIFKETEIDNKSFYEMMRKKGIPKSSQPSVGDLYKEMESIVKEGHSLLGIFLSSDMSGTYSTANTARDMIIENYPTAKVEVIDSRSNCMQLGFAVTVAARAALEGKTLGQAKKAAEEIIKKSRFLFIPDSLEYLEKGGRIGKANAIIGNFLKIIPILTVENGVTTIFKKVRTKKKAVLTMVEQVLQDIKALGLGEIVVHHIDCIDEAREVANEIKQVLDVDISIQAIGPVIGLHVGPGTVAIAYYTKENMR